MQRLGGRLEVRQLGVKAFSGWLSSFVGLEVPFFQSQGTSRRV